VNQCGITQAFDPASSATPPPVVQFNAIWDTGATNCVITQAVVDACGLAPIGMTRVQGVHGTEDAEVYLVNVYLPNQVFFQSVRVTKGAFVGADILIGMDIITQGDFAVTNLGGVTKFSYRYPSETHIDFVVEQNKRNVLTGQTHGPGKRQRRKRKK
jgi:hypothetical protein